MSDKNNIKANLAESQSLTEAIGEEVAALADEGATTTGQNTPLNLTSLSFNHSKKRLRDSIRGLWCTFENSPSRVDTIHRIRMSHIHLGRLL